MPELFSMLVQSACAIGLLYGLLVTLQHWSDMVPEDGDSDGQFANHGFRGAGMRGLGHARAVR